MDKESNEKLIKVELNDRGDYIVISTGDNAFFEWVAQVFKRIVDMAEEIPKKCHEIEAESGRDEMEKIIEEARVNISFSEEAVRMIDGVFGDGTIRKYFYRLYEEVPDFIPDCDCFTDFFDKITPVMEQLLGVKMDERETARFRTMNRHVRHGRKRKRR